MATQYEQARAGVVTPQMEQVAVREHIAPQTVREEVAAGRLVIPANRLHLEGIGYEPTGEDMLPQTTTTRKQGIRHEGVQGDEQQRRHASANNNNAEAWHPIPMGLVPCGIGRALTTKINANLAPRR